MLTRSANYQSIYSGSHRVEWRVTVNGTVYGTNKLASETGGGDAHPRLRRTLFPKNSPSIGGCCAATFECTIFEASSNVPRMATVVPAYRLVTIGNQSEWITLGTFYVDTRSVDKATGALTLSCYDSMLKADGAEGKSYASLTSFDEWPQSMSAVVNEIASIMFPGVANPIDSRTAINSGTGYMVEYPNDYTMREILQYIAAAHAGNWCITPENKLRLIPLTGGNGSLNIGGSTTTLKTSAKLSGYTGVTIYWADESAFSAGDNTGNTLEAECPWATQETANDILSALSGYQYQPYTASGAYIDYALELGDSVTVGLTGETVTGPCATIDITCDVGNAADLEAPVDEEVDHEYPYADRVDRALKRRVGLGQAYEGVVISRQNGIEIARTDDTAKAIFNSHVFEMDAKVDGNWVRRIYFDPVRGDYVFDGALGANAVFTDSLYAERGDVAELTVDRVSTSKRIRKYLLRDTSDDNYILIQDRSIKLITASPAGLYIRLLTEDNALFITESGENLDAEAQGSSSFEIAKNRYGQNLYWEQNIENAEIDTDGYPFIDGKQVYVTTQNTGCPVYVYQYTELVKAEYSFVDSNGTYVPVQIWGAGSGYSDYGKGFIEKLTNMFQLSYKTRSGVKESLQFNDDGWVDINSMRKPLQFNFTNFDSGSFTETIDGGTTVTYSVTFDAQGRVASIRDGAGHLTEVIW